MSPPAPTSAPRPHPEILAPGGDPDAVRAAILAGADAVYLGLGRFNARMRATNLELPELRALCRLAHSHGVRVYVTLNVIVTEGELEVATALGRDALAAGADALILQDLGLVAWFREHVPEAELHASTQLTTHGAAQLELLARAGVTQVNLSRELSLEEIRALAARAHALGLRVEVFVHGAYCVSFSGQCYLSSFMTGHSGNRGECVQPCRRAFSSCGGRAPRYPLNLKDNNAISAAAALVEAGADAFKIEGRRKGFYYVHTAVRAWRTRLDALAGGARVDGDDPALGTVFNRGFSIGYLQGRITPSMFAADGNDRSLTPLGEVASYTADTRTLRCAGSPDLAPGTRAGVFTREMDYVAQLVVEAREAPGRFRVRLEHELKGKIQPGQQLCALAEQAAADAVLAQVRALAPRRRPLTVRVAGRAGEPLRAVFVPGPTLVGPEVDGPAAVGPGPGGPLTARAQSRVALQPATKNALGPAQLREHLGKLGETGFELATLDAAELAPDLFLPVSELNRVRQAAVAALAAAAAPTLPVAAPRPAPPAGPPPPAPPLRQRLLFITGTLDDARAVRALGGAGGFVALELQGAADPVAHAPEPGLEEWLAPLFPAIIFDGELPAYEAALARRPWRLVVSDHAGLGARAAAAGIPWLAGGLLNVGNSRALAALAALAGAGGAIASPELTVEQLRALGAAAAPGGLLRLATICGPLLSLQTRQCLVRGFRRCGREAVDGWCLAHCRAAGELALEPDTARFHAVKRPGFHNQLWDARLLFYPEAVAALGPAVDAVVVDLRDPGFLGRSPALTLRLARFFCEAVRRGRPDAAELARLRPLLGPCCRGPLGRTRPADPATRRAPRS